MEEYKGIVQVGKTFGVDLTRSDLVTRPLACVPSLEVDMLVQGISV